ncbi:hypothetical protein BL253_04015 [Pseudofrankia asymbiotica]|uniref:Uncharacterized protein n=1 Tax=Pseudofrankia asymbiotica TaxID=1834516 RepID=A0A1V2IKF8_9ACTN|nr:hypothetical protein BL253_04015 [Pseudofrankia asymbiotica]
MATMLIYAMTMLIYVECQEASDSRGVVSRTVGDLTMGRGGEGCRPGHHTPWTDEGRPRRP